MRVSVIIPTYNHGNYVLQTLESVFAQSFEDYEVIVVNDGSPDQTAQVLAPLAQAGRIVYIEQPNAGQAAARNCGLEQARGEFIAFLDDDDLWPPDKLQWQVDFLDANPDIALVAGAVQCINGAGSNLGTARFYDRPVTLEALFSGCPFVSPGQTLIRAWALRQVGGLDQTLWGADDFDLWFRLLGRGIRAQPQLSLYYRQHASNASGDTVKMFDNITRVIRAHLPQVRAARRAQCSRAAYRWLYRYIGHFAVGRLRVQKLSPLRQSLQDAKLLCRFFWPALRDRRLLARIERDARPNVFRPKECSSGKPKTGT